MYPGSGAGVINVLGILYLVGLVVHLFIGFIWWCCLDERRVWYSEPPIFLVEEMVVWSLLWPICDLFVTARFLAKGVEQLGARL